MNRTLATSALALACLLGVSACASDTPAPPASATTVAVATESGIPEEPSPDASPDVAEPADEVMPAGARAASSDFAFPVPEDWPELSPFAEEKIGGDTALAAIFGYPSDADSAAATYSALLTSAGFEVSANPLGEVVHLASFTLEGSVDGVRYHGSVDFDTDADGTSRAIITIYDD